MERVIVTIDTQGNTSAASVPLALDTGIRDGRVKRGQLLLLEAFGGGFTWGSALDSLLIARGRRSGAQRKTPRCYRGALAQVKCSIYFDTDFLNMRSIFSLIASMAVEFDCAVDNA